MKFWNNFLVFLEKHFSRLEVKLSIIEESLGLTCERIDIPSAFEANGDPIYTITNEPTILLVENEERHNLIIQNIGLHPCLIRLDEGIKLDNFHFVLAADTEDKQGNGGSIELKGWHGRVCALCEQETKVSVLEY